MAVPKVKRSHHPPQPTSQPSSQATAQPASQSTAQPQPQHRSPKPAGPDPRRHQIKAEIFDLLRNLNRGYGVALAALDRLETKAREQSRGGPRIFPTGYLHGYRSRAEVLRAETNRDLLRLIAGHEDQDAVRFATPLIAKSAKDAKP